MTQITGNSSDFIWLFKKADFKKWKPYWKQKGQDIDFIYESRF